MDNLLFSTLLILIAYYFFYHLPNQKTPNPVPNLLSRSTQTETSPNPPTIQKLEAEKTALLKDQAHKERTIIGLNQSYEKLEQTKTKEVKALKEQITELQQQLAHLTHSQTHAHKELGQTLDQLIKGMNELNKEIDNS
jgi:predicted  nucleic acid-binding Zn-ribbon protein